MKKCALKILTATKWLLLPLLVAPPVVAQAQFTFTTNEDQIMITGYTGSAPVVTVPAATNGYPVTSIGTDAFSGNNTLASVAIPASVTNIGDFAFYFCPSLRGVTIPTNVANLGESAFANCYGLTNVAIPASVISLGESAFAYCTSLTNITVAAANSSYSSLGGVLFDKAEVTLLQYPAGLNRTNYLLPASVTSVGTTAFAGGDSLTSIAIPTGVTNIGDYAFYDCFNVGSVTLPSTIARVGQFAFGDCIGVTNVTVAASAFSIGSYAFSGCPRLTAVYCEGNSPFPINDLTVFSGESVGTVYYFPETVGWGTKFDGWPTAPWILPKPQIVAGGASPGVKSGGFGFTITWPVTNIALVVEASTNLANPGWMPLSTNVLTDGTFQFTDPRWTNYSARFYRVTAP